ncbi:MULTISPECIES: DeoR/GlpR family DNA-binding transcription regulator [Vagococcus]|uniref:DeoR/GlpR family DNA-binding transcription regulator n=1 Tax=Vagococcus TaxID=2737 RepID=UPI002FC5E34D
MNQQERLVKIIDLLEDTKKLKQEEIADYFNISKDTARRDIIKLVEKELVERTKGGIQLPVIKQQLTDYQDRIIQNSSQKKIIAQLGSQLIKEKQTIWLDVSTTVELLSKESLPQNSLFVTNSIDNAVSFSPIINQLYLLGGYYQSDSRVLKGPMLTTQLNNFYFDLAFIGASGISEEGIFFDELEDIDLHLNLRDKSKRVVLLVDSSKQQQRTSFKIAWDSIDTLITNSILDDSLTEAITKHPIDIIYP